MGLVLDSDVAWLLGAEASEHGGPGQLGDDAVEFGDDASGLQLGISCRFSFLDRLSVVLETLTPIENPPASL